MIWIDGIDFLKSYPHSIHKVIHIWFHVELLGFSVKVVFDVVADFFGYGSAGLEA